jgi:hypothetical protein
MKSIFQVGLTYKKRHAAVHLVEALRYKQEGRGSIPNGVIGIFYLHNPSGCGLTLGSNKPVPEMITRNISWGLKAPSA